MSASWKGLVDMRNLQILVSPVLLKGQTEIYEFPYLPHLTICHGEQIQRPEKGG